MDILIPIIIVAVIVIIFFRRSKKNDAIRQQAQEQTKAGAQAVGLNVTAQAEGSVRGGEVLGATDYQGNTGGIAWTLRSLKEAGSKGRIMRRSLWKTNAAAWPAGKFLLIISHSGEYKGGEIKRGGFFNNLVNMAADAMLDFYVGAFFGSQYKSLVNIGEDTVKIKRDALAGFDIFTNFPETAEAFLDEGTVNVLSGWKKSSQGFRRETQVDNFGLLFTPDGMLLGCQSDMTTAEEVKLFSDFGSALAVKMQGMTAVVK